MEDFQICISVPLNISQYLQEDTCVRIFFNKVTDLKRLQHRYFPVILEIF